MMIGYLILTLTTEQRKSVSSLLIGDPQKKQHSYHGAFSQQIFDKRHNQILFTCYKLCLETSNSEVSNVITRQSGIKPLVSLN